MTDLNIPNTIRAWIASEPPHLILHVEPTFPQPSARKFTFEYFELVRAVARTIGFRRDIDDAVFHWPE